MSDQRSLDHPEHFGSVHSHLVVVDAHRGQRSRSPGSGWQFDHATECDHRCARRDASPRSSWCSSAGCTSVKMTGTPRTGTEQLLLTGTWDNALAHVDFSSLAGHEGLPRPPVYHGRRQGLDHLFSIRRTMAEQGLLLENNKDKAQVIVEVAFGAYGTDERDRKFGLPGFSIAPSLTTGAALSSSGSSTSLTFSETNQQDAVVKASLFAYEAKTGRLVWESSPLFNAQGVRDHFVMGSGPYR